MGGRERDRSIRVGIMLDGLVCDAWVARVISDVRSCSGAECCVLILNGDQPDSLPMQSRRASVSEYVRFVLRAPFRKHHLYEQYVAEDQRYFGTEPCYNSKVDLSESLKDVPRVHVQPRREGFADYFCNEALEAVRVYKPDVLLRFGFRILKGEVLTVPRYGIWSYHHGDNRHYRGGPALFWEMVEDAPVSGVILQKLSAELDNGLVLYRSHSATFSHSLFVNRNQTYFKAAAFVGRVLRDVLRRGWEAVEAEAKEREGDSPKGRLYRTPVNGEVLRYLDLRRKRFQREPRRYEERWNLLLASSGVTGQLPSAERFHLLENPAGRFRADPCLYEREGKTWLFFEEYSYEQGKGWIGCAEVLSEAKLGSVRKVLERTYHLSAPYVFSWQGQTYLLPESCANKTVELYRCEAFPDTWKLERVLLAGITAVDSKLLWHEGRWWLFTNVAEPGAGTWDELHVFYAESLSGPWLPHARNPVVSDVRYARPAGELFIRDGRLMRPSQDCSISYGRALNIMEIETLNPEEYRERLVEHVDPEAFSAEGVHSFTSAGGWVAMDIKRMVPSAAPWAAKRMSTYPFLPMVWPAKHFFPPLARLERLAVRGLKRLLGRGRNKGSA